MFVLLYLRVSVFYWLYRKWIARYCDILCLFLDCYFQIDGKYPFVTHLVVVAVLNTLKENLRVILRL